MKAARILPACVVLVLLLGGQRVVAEGWSLWGDSSTPEKKKTTVNPYKSTKKEPSTLDKLTAGPKKVFTKIGDTVTGKKPAVKKPTRQYTPWMSSKDLPQNRPPEKKSWPASWFQPKEPEQPKSPSEWITQKRLEF